MRKIAVCGVWHVHAPDYTREAMKHSVVVGVWDENKERKEAFAKSFDIPAFDSLDDLLESEADGVIVCTSTDTHADVMVRIANAGKDIFTEKVLGLTDDECERVEKAVKKNDVSFVISLVQKYQSGPLTVKSIVDSGEIGNINYVRFRNCHSGSTNNWLPRHFYDKKECGGGAMIDLGAHGMYLINWICGMPTSYKSVFTNATHNEGAKALNTDMVEDNAVTVMGFENGTIAVNETGFVSLCYPMTLEVDGDKGYACFDGSKVVKKSKETDGKEVTVEMLPSQDAPIKQFLFDNIDEGCTMESAKALTHMMVEAYK